LTKEAEKLMTPKFMTVRAASTAVTATFDAVFGLPNLPGLLRDDLRPRRDECHVVILVPGTIDHYEQNFPNWPDYPIKPVLLYEESRGDPAKFEHPFDEIARCKAMQLWTDRNDDRTDNIPHLMFRGDTPYWGGVKRREIVVACSGVQPCIDKLISGMVADMLVALAHSAWMESEDKAKEVSFLT
jgi:hypothetical protein